VAEVPIGLSLTAQEKTELKVTAVEGCRREILFFGFVAGLVMTMDVKAETQKNTSPQECAGCGKRITER
jgi:hypothetical protein